MPNPTLASSHDTKMPITSECQHRSHRRSPASYDQYVLEEKKKEEKSEIFTANASWVIRLDL